MSAVLHVVSDRRCEGVNLEDALVSTAAGGADVLQIREKRAPASDTYTLCQAIASRCRELATPPRLFVNDRLDIALAVDASGIHLSSRSLPVAVARRVLERANWMGMIGVSVHSLEEAREAASAGADYLTFGHIFASESHRGQPPRGLLALTRVVDAVHVPVIAIGGIDVTNVGPVLATGCAGVAVIGAVLGSPNVVQATIALKAQMAAASTPPKVAFPS